MGKSNVDNMPSFVKNGGIIGINVSALFRNFLNLAGLDWQDCLYYGDKFDNEISANYVGWLSSDNGTTFNRSFDPTKESVK